MNKPLNTIYEFEFYDGTKAPLTLAFYMLLQLKGKNKSLYYRYTKIMVKQSKGDLDELDTITLLYTAYCCASLNSSEPLMTEEDFMMKCGSDRKAVGEALQHLLNPKKQ